MPTIDVTALPAADSFVTQLDDFRTTVKNAITQVITELGDEADASEFDLRYMPVDLTELDADIVSMKVTDDDDLTLGYSDGSEVQLDELSTDDLVGLYQELMDLAEALNGENTDTEE
ncbi:MAG: hypothetical protein LH606_08740 [Cytophagaceae bacterium]|nr:hypothetical protein [Cytophagaceae bacterium]